MFDASATNPRNTIVVGIGNNPERLSDLAKTKSAGGIDLLHLREEEIELRVSAQVPACKQNHPRPSAGVNKAATLLLASWRMKKRSFAVSPISSCNATGLGT